MDKKLSDFFPKQAAERRQEPDERDSRMKSPPERKKGTRMYTDRYKNFNPRFDTPDLAKRFNRAVIGKAMKSRKK